MIVQYIVERISLLIDSSILLENNKEIQEIIENATISFQVNGVALRNNFNSFLKWLETDRQTRKITARGMPVSLIAVIHGSPYMANAK